MEDNIKKISAVISALNKITVCGKQNLSNLSGSISVLEDVYAWMVGQVADAQE